MEKKEDVKSEESIQVVAFNLASETYGFPIMKVQEILRLSPVTQIPQTPEFLEGVINLRGFIIPILDLRKRFSLPVQEHTDQSRVIVAELQGQTAGMVVDMVSQVLTIPADRIEAPPPSVSIDARFISGVGKLDDALIILLDMDEILDRGEKESMKNMDQQTATIA